MVQTIVLDNRLVNCYWLRTNKAPFCRDTQLHACNNPPFTDRVLFFKGVMHGYVATSYIRQIRVLLHWMFSSTGTIVIRPYV